MIWIVFGILVLASLLYLVSPLTSRRPPALTPDSEIRSYHAEIRGLSDKIAAIDDPTEKKALEQARLHLQRQILKRDQQNTSEHPLKALVNLLFVGMVPAALGLYLWLGQPQMAHPQQHPNIKQSSMSAPAKISNERIQVLIAQLEAKLKQQPFASDPKGWRIYAHALMSVHRYDEATAAYQKALRLSHNKKDLQKEIQTEYDKAKSWIARTKPQTRPKTSPKASPGPTSQQMREAQKMSPAERQAMIQNMVNGLSAKLRDNPKDVAGWVRLLKARRVLGQTEAANTEIARMKKAFIDEPGTITEILEQSGWTQK